MLFCDSHPLTCTLSIAFERLLCVSLVCSSVFSFLNMMFFADAEDLPDTQDILGGIPPGPFCQSPGISQRSPFEPNAAAACNHQQQITSALCVLVNMVEHSPTAGSCIAQLDLSVEQAVPEVDSSAANSPSETAQGPGEHDYEQRNSQITCSQQSSDSTSRARLASGSRRRRRNGARPAVEEAEVQPKVARAALQTVHPSNGVDMHKGMPKLAVLILTGVVNAGVSNLTILILTQLLCSGASICRVFSHDNRCNHVLMCAIFWGQDCWLQCLLFSSV